MRKEERDMSISEMQKAIYMKQEKTVDDIMINQIMKQGQSYRPVIIIIVLVTFSLVAVQQDLMKKMIQIFSNTRIRMIL